MPERISSSSKKPRNPSTNTTVKPMSSTALAVSPFRSLLKPTIALSLCLFLISLYALSSSPFLPPLSSTTITPTPSSSSSSSYSATATTTTPPKIYLYNLPSKFTTGVIQNYLLARNPSASSSLNLRYPGHQHSAEWHLFTDLSNPRRPLYSALTVVDDPESADLFYVPFFSSLSLVVNPARSPDANSASQMAYSDERMQEELVEWLEDQPYWQRNNGRDHVFICQDPNALYKVIDRIKNAMLLVSDFGRLRPDQGSLVKDVILPYSHRINPYKGEIGVVNRPSLLFFMGNRYRKEGGKIRDALFQLLEGEKDVVIKHGAQSRESRRMATRGMHSSKFCLHPAGDTPSACRLFDAIVSLCVPVIVSDYIELPFEDVIDYKKIAIFVETMNAVKPRYLTSMLRRISSKRILQYQKELEVVKRFFEYEDPNGTVPEVWRQVALKVPLIKLMINRDKRLVTRGPGCSCVCSGHNGTSIREF